MEKTKILIIDDDAPSRKLLRDGLKRYDWASVCGEASDSRQAVEMVRDLAPGLVFLDIELNDVSALDILEELKELGGGNTRFVFYTTYSKYLMQALRMEAFDFLLKPYDSDELNLIMNRYKLACARDYATAAPPADRLANMRVGNAVPTGISVTTITNDRMILFPRDVVYFRYDTNRKLWEVVLSTLQHIILKRNTTADTILNYGPQFVRTHKSYIVNIGFISMISGNECRLIPPYDNITDIKISKVYRPQLLDMFYDL